MRVTGYDPIPTASIEGESLVVTDMSWLQARPAHHNDILSNADHYLIPDVCLQELIGRYNEGKNNEALGQFRKLQRIVRQHKQRIWVSNFWDELSRQEIRQRVAVDPNAIINHEMSRRISEIIELSSDELVKRFNLAGDSEENQEHESKRQEFIRLCKRWTEWILSQDGAKQKLEQMNSCEKEQHFWVRQPEQPVELVAQHNKKYDDPQWRRALDCFPDRFAAGRWARLIIWYALQQSLMPDRKRKQFENDWDDAHYVFCASYTGHIATNDKGMKRAVAAVFPHVQIYDE